jgi:arylsulfatase A-like enzyme
MRRLFLLATLVLCAGRPAPVQAAPRPNIIFIMADDLGWTDIGCMGTRYYETPNIDRLSRQGVIMRSYYACQNCAPTRAALMSGQYAPRTGVYTVGSFKRGNDKNRLMVPPVNKTRLPLDRQTMADVLQQAGYVTGMFGKWHLGNEPEYQPGKRGFDEAIVSNGRHFKFRTKPSVPVREGEYLADFLTDRAVDFIERHQQETFFLYLAHFAVHTPIQAKQPLIDRFTMKPPVGGHKNPVYAAMIQSVDESVGRVMKVLDDLEIADQTLLIFASDNGGLGGYRVPGTDNRKGITDNTPLRGGKGMLYEGGVRVPFVARWPGNIPAGSKSEEPIVHVDMFPTFMQLAGVRKVDQRLDGVSILPLLREPSRSLKRDAIYWHFPGYLESYIPDLVWRTTPVSTIRRGDYKLLEFFEQDRLELYNIKQDPGEQHDLAQQHQQLVKELHQQLVAWRLETGALMARTKTAEELANPAIRQRKK